VLLRVSRWAQLAKYFSEWHVSKKILQKNEAHVLCSGKCFLKACCFHDNWTQLSKRTRIVSVAYLFLLIYPPLEWKATNHRYSPEIPGGCRYGLHFSTLGNPCCRFECRWPGFHLLHPHADSGCNQDFRVNVSPQNPSCASSTCPHNGLLKNTTKEAVTRTTLLVPTDIWLRESFVSQHSVCAVGNMNCF
jgi:hypothetical protein